MLIPGGFFNRNRRGNPLLVKKMLAEEHSGVCISTGCPRWAGPRWASPPCNFGSSHAPIPLCFVARFRSLLAPRRLPRWRLAVPGRHDSRRRRRTNRRSGAARPTPSPLPGAPPCLPSQSVQGSGMHRPLSQPDLS